MKNGINNALAIEGLAETGRRINAGGSGSGRHKMGENASSKDDHLAAAKYHSGAEDDYPKALAAGGPGSGRKPSAAGQALHDHLTKFGYQQHMQIGQTRGYKRSGSGVVTVHMGSGAWTKESLPNAQGNTKTWKGTGLASFRGKTVAAENAGSIHSILDKYRIKQKLAKENPPSSLSKKKMRADDALPLVSPRDAA